MQNVSVRLCKQFMASTARKTKIFYYQQVK